MGGKVLTRLDNAGNKSSTVFSVDGLLTAVQNVSPYGSSLRWTHIDPLGLSEAGDTKGVYDPIGNYIQWQQAPTGPPRNAYPPSAASFGGLGPSFGYAINGSCILNGIPTDCRLALNMLAHGAADQCPSNDCGPQIVRDSGGNQHVSPLATDPNTGSLGYYYWDPKHDRGGLKDDSDNDIPVIRINNQGGYVWKDTESAVLDFFGIGPQNPDVQKTYSRTFNCNKTNRDIFHRLRTHFPQFANFNGNFGSGGLASASVSVGSGTITKGATIPIHNVDVGPGGSFPTTFDVAVKVATVSTMAGRSMGFSFDTLPGHVLYPASISFFAVQGDQGSVNFSINVNGNFSSTTNKELFNHAAGDDLENKIWNNLIDNVERYCGHEPQ